MVTIKTLTEPELDSTNESSPLLRSDGPSRMSMRRERISGEITPLPKFQLSILLLVEMCEPLMTRMIRSLLAHVLMELNITHGDNRKIGYYAGILESIFFVAEAFVVLFWSRISDAVGRKPVLLIGLTGLCLTTISFGLSRTFVTLLLSRCVAGLLHGNLAVLKSLMAEITDETNRADGFASITIVWAVGGCIAPFIGGALAYPQDRFPSLFTGQFWKMYPFFLPCAAISTFIALAFAFTSAFLLETRQMTLSSGKTNLQTDAHVSVEANLLQHGSPKDKATPAGLTPIRDLLVFRVLIAVANYGSIAFLDLALQSLVVTFFSLPIELGGLGFSPFTIGVCLAILGFSSSVFQVLFFGKILRRVGPKPIFCMGIAVYAVIFGLFPLISSAADSSGGVTLVIWMLLGAQLVLSLLKDIALSTILIYVTAAAPNRHCLGSTNGLGQTTASVARATSPLLTLSAFSFSAQHNLLHGNAVYLGLVILSGFALLLAVQLPTKLWRKEDEDDN